MPIGKVIKVDVITDFEPTVAVIDPKHQNFDENRFNNSTHLPGLSIFPGNTETLSDKEYTVVWLPYLLRRPGENTTIGARSKLFRYIDEMAHLKIETAPPELGYQFDSTSKLPWKGSTVDLQLAKSYDGKQRAKIVLVKKFHLPDSLGQFKGSIYFQENKIDSLDNYSSVGAKGLYISSLFDNRCDFIFNSERELTPEQEKTEFYYEKDSLKTTFACGELNPAVEITSFYGNVTSKEKVPEPVFFKINRIEEASVRIDSAKVPYSSRLAAISSNLYIPIRSVLGSKWGLVGKRLRWHVFYDFGRSLIPEATYQAAGIGVHLPFGGDVIATGSLTVAEVSILAILYNRVKGQDSYSPSIIFNLSGLF